MPNSTSFVGFVAAAALAAGVSQADSAIQRCTASEFHQFDFWLGDWDTFESGAPSSSIARARVVPIAAGCGIHELYEQTDGLIGDSILSFDPVRKMWQQTWITNGGSLMVIAGTLKGDALELEGETHSGSGRAFLQRITWKPEGAGVRESSVTSNDGGKTWQAAFDVLFEKHR